MQRTRLFWIIMIIAFVLIIFFMGPTVPIDQTIRPANVSEDVEAYVAQEEAKIRGLRPNTEKIIIWANPETKEKTPLVLVYLHGYSATRQEIAPVVDNVAQALGANVFYTRMTGHGLDGEALAKATVNDWLNDGIEAIEIGRHLGDRIVIIGSSTGGTLATWLATQEGMSDVAALVFVSPNFRLNTWQGELLLWPWAEVFVPLIAGAERSIEPFNEQHALYWTTTYPTVAAMPIQGLIKLSRDLDLSQIKQPLFIVYSPEDQVVDPKVTQTRFAEFGSRLKKLIALAETQDPLNHVITGAIRSPGTTEAVVQMILEFLAEIDVAELGLGI